MAQRFDLLALWVLVDGTASGRGNLPYLGLSWWRDRQRQRLASVRRQSG
jgi:hypothetical protein